MIQLFKDAAMTTELIPLTRYTGVENKSSFIAQHGVWNICVDDFKEVDYTLDSALVKIANAPAAGANIIIIPPASANLEMKNTDAFKEFTNTLYVSTPTPQTANLMLKLEHDYPEITAAELKIFGAGFTRCADCYSAAVGPHPVHMKLTVPASSDIRLFSDIQLCAVRFENTEDSTYLSVNDAGEINFALFTPSATQKRRAVLNVL